MSYAESLLANNERFVYETRKHWVAPLLSTITGTAADRRRDRRNVRSSVHRPPWLNNLFLYGGLIALLLGVALLINAFVKWWSEHYFVTNQKVLKVSGILRKSAEGSALEKINDITIHQTLLGRWLGYGTLKVLTAADESNLIYTAMREPMEFRKAILDEKQTFEQQDARSIADAVRQPTPRRRPRPSEPPPVRSPTRSSASRSCVTAGRSPPRTTRRRRRSCSAGCELEPPPSAGQCGACAPRATGAGAPMRRHHRVPRGGPPVLDPVVEPGEPADPELDGSGTRT